MEALMGAGWQGVKRRLGTWTALVVLGVGMGVATGAARPGRAAEAWMPPPGEKLVFRLRWTLVPAGEATLEVLPHSDVDGRPARHFRLTARSNAFLDNFYKVRDRIDTRMDMTASRTLHYRKRQREGGTHRDVEVRFDWDANRAHYFNFGRAQPPIDLMDGSVDPLGAFYRLRAMGDLAVGQELACPVTDGKKNVLGRARVVRRQTVRVPAGTFDTFLIEPELKHVGGVFEKSPKARIRLWVTADARHIPVKLTSRVVVGSFVGELVHLEHP